MGSYGSLWFLVLMGLYCSLWDFMGPYVCVFVFMFSYGSLWVLVLNGLYWSFLFLMSFYWSL